MELSVRCFGKPFFPSYHTGRTAPHLLSLLLYLSLTSFLRASMGLSLTTRTIIFGIDVFMALGVLYKKKNQLKMDLTDRARDRHSKDIVALKRMRMEKEDAGLAVSSLREISILQGLLLFDSPLELELVVLNFFFFFFFF